MSAEGQKIEFFIVGITDSAGSGGSFLVFLKEKHGNRSLPIVIGAFEAQAIAVELQKLKTPRPLTHDLFYNVLSSYKIKLLEVAIIKLLDGVFFANMIFQNQDGDIQIIDARTSDAIALAVRFDAPIFIASSVLNAVLSPEPESMLPTMVQPATEEPKTQRLSIEELEKQLQKAIQEEDYESAAKIRDELSKRKP